MKVVLDTNVLGSGIFFGGMPRQLLDAWAELVVSPAIIDEYLRTCDRFAASHPALEDEAVLATLIGHATLTPDASPERSVTADPDDDKLMLCSRPSSAVVVSGDRHLLDAAGWEGVSVLAPRDFLTALARDSGPSS